MKRSLLALGLLTSLAYADDVPSSDPYATCKLHNDCDLFRKDKAVLFINADFLYWKVSEGATDFAIKMRQPAWSTSQPTYATGKYKNAKFDWTPGFRLAFGYFNAPSYWDAQLQYTYLHATGEKEVHAPSKANTFLVGSWIGPDFSLANGAAPLREASSRTDFHYNLLDLLFSRRFHPNPHLRVGLVGGVAAAFIEQKWTVFLTDIQNQQSKVRNKWKFTGAGLRAGLIIDWFLHVPDLYLSTWFNGALLSGRYKNKAFQNTDAAVSGANNRIPFRNTHFKDFRLAGTMQFFAGPSWQRNFTNLRTSLTAGYEFTIWANLHEVYRSELAAPTAGKDTHINSSLISIQGLTVRANIDF